MSADPYELAEQVYALPRYERLVFYDELERLDPMFAEFIAEHGAALAAEEAKP